MKTISIILTLILTSQIAFASNSNPNCSNQLKSDRKMSLENCKLAFANELPSCKGNKIKQKQTQGTDFSDRRG